jgi:hypothetical protein
MAEVEQIKILGESIGVWIQTGAVVLSAFYAGRQVRLLRVQTDKNEQQLRLRATVDMVLHEKQDSLLRDARVKFAAIRDGKNNITQYACVPVSNFPDENAAIMAILNNYEFMAAGIREGAFDEGIYKRMKKSLVIRDWNALSGYALEMRQQTGRDKLFVETQWLAKKWEDEERLQKLMLV